MTLKAHFHHFKTPIQHLSPPQRFTYPFYYKPHPLAVIACEELQAYLHTYFDAKKEKRGKMYGVLVVENQAKELGYLIAYSGAITEGYDMNVFVPPVFDMNAEGSFLNLGMKEIEGLQQQIITLENAPDYLTAQQQLNDLKAQATAAIEKAQEQKQVAKARRRQKRREAQSQLSEEAYQELDEQLSIESLKYHKEFKQLKKDWKQRISAAEEHLQVFKRPIQDLKNARAATSARLQQQLFEQYTFLNIEGSRKSLAEIFPETPPAGAGECAAPKLLQFAFLNGLKPVCLAEFWWGPSPKSTIRKHLHYYPACRGKCYPILGEMLKGLPVEANPLLHQKSDAPSIRVVYEEERFLVIDKPEKMLSVPGKELNYSVLSWIKEQYPKAEGPITVHRLDFATSGLMLIAKDLETYQLLQKQFMERKVQKRYVAILDGILEEEEGLIELPLRTDFDDRPRQMVCYEYGKPAQTYWKAIQRKNGKTMVHFFPITGRTHQLRVHAAHHNGLNCPILGDVLYGKHASRLHLHAENLKLKHPYTNKKISFNAPAPFVW